MYAFTHVCMCRHFNAVAHGEKPVYFVDFLEDVYSIYIISLNIMES